MYLRFSRRIKDGKEHRYWSIVESKRCSGGKVVQRPVLYLGEINDDQHEAWCRVIEALDQDHQKYRQLALFPAARGVPEHAKGSAVGATQRNFRDGTQPGRVAHEAWRSTCQSA